MNEYLNWTDEQLIEAGHKLKRLLPLAPAEIMRMQAGGFKTDGQIVYAAEVLKKGQLTYELIKAEYYLRHPEKQKK